MPEKLLDLHEASERLGFCTRTIREMARKGTLPGLRVGWQWRIREAALDQWIKEQDTTSSAERP